MKKTNLLQKKLTSSNTVFGTWSSLSSPNVINVIGCTELDFVIIDLEHGSMSYETVENMVRAAEASNIAPIVRVGDDQQQTILRALETGTRTILVPHVNTSDKAEKIAKFCKYYPNGNRGLSPYTRGHNFTHNDIAESLENENKITLVGILVEGQEGLKNLEHIVKVEGIDLVYLGLFDICQSVGLPGQVNHPTVIDEISRCNQIIKSNGLYSGCMATSTDNVLMLKNIGYNFIAYLNDAAALKKHFDDVLMIVKNDPQT